jgi:hypothetical protein
VTDKFTFHLSPFTFHEVRSTVSISTGGSERLLKQGLAAAHAVVFGGSEVDRKEAEFFLDWALSSGLPLNDQMEAWLWLSRIATTPERKKECLDNVLAIRPSHPDARRDMAVLEGRLKPEDVRADPWASGQGVAQSATVARGEARRFPCPKCGASMLMQPGMSTLTCQFCGAKVDEQGQLAGDAPRVGGSEDVSEQDWVKAIYTGTGHDWHLPASRVLKCEGCGAVVTLAPARISARCLYCGSPYTVRAAPADSHLREPDGVVPFGFDAPAARDHARKWLSGQSGVGGAPDDLAALATLHDLQPIYLPFWSFDVGGEVRWSGYVRDDMGMGMGPGMDNFDTAMAVGGMMAFGAMGVALGGDFVGPNMFDLAGSQTEAQKQVFTEGAVPVHLSDVTVPATTSVAPRLLESLKYDAKAALPYKESLLASWPAEVYTVSIADASLKARQVAIADTDKDIKLLTGEVMGNEISSLTKDRRGMTVVSYKLLLLPAWTAGYAYRGKEYRLVVNGQTGDVEGFLPRKEGTINKLLGKRE